MLDLGVMGFEIPEQHVGGAGATLFHSVLAVESLSRADLLLVLVDVQNTLVVSGFNPPVRGDRYFVCFRLFGSGFFGHPNFC